MNIQKPAIFFLFLLLCISNLTFSAPLLIIKNKDIIAGKIPYSNNIEFSYTVFNKGNETAIISDILYTCKFASVKYDSEIKPGENGKIYVQLFLEPSISSIAVGFVIINNSADDAIGLSYKAEIIHDIYAFSDNDLPIDIYPDTKLLQKNFYFLSLRSNLEIVDVHSDFNFMKAKYKKIEKIDEFINKTNIPRSIEYSDIESLWYINIEIDAVKALKYLEKTNQDYICGSDYIIYTNDNRYPLFPIGLKFQKQSYFISYPDIVRLKANSKEKNKIIIKNKCRKNFCIRDIKSSIDFVSANRITKGSLNEHLLIISLNYDESSSEMNGLLKITTDFKPQDKILIPFYIEK